MVFLFYLKENVSPLTGVKDLNAALKLQTGDTACAHQSNCYKGNEAPSGPQHLRHVVILSLSICG